MTRRSTRDGQARPCFDRLLAALEDHGERGWARGLDATVTCPGHPDRDPSLHITYVPERGLLLLCCFANCDTGDILAELGLTLRDLYDRPGRRAAQEQESYAQRVDARDQAYMRRIAERAHQQELIEADPRYWLRRAAEFDQVGTPAGEWFAWACRHRAEVSSW